jgi:hypothetical protein
MIVATIQWGGNANVSLAGAAFSQVANDDLNPRRVATFFASDVSGAVAATAALDAPTTAEANLVVSAYKRCRAAPDLASPAPGAGTAAMLPFQTHTLSAGDWSTRS